jgi:hypothetical protein
VHTAEYVLEDVNLSPAAVKPHLATFSPPISPSVIGHARSIFTVRATTRSAVQIFRPARTDLSRNTSVRRLQPNRE